MSALLRPGGGIGPEQVGPVHLRLIAGWLRALAEVLAAERERIHRPHEWDALLKDAVLPFDGCAEDAAIAASILEAVAEAQIRLDAAGVSGR